MCALLLPTSIQQTLCIPRSRCQNNELCIRQCFWWKVKDTTLYSISTNETWLVLFTLFSSVHTGRRLKFWLSPLSRFKWSVRGRQYVYYMYIAWNHINKNCILFHVFCVSSVLLSSDLTFSRIPGDQGGPLFFRLRILFFGGGFTYKLVYYNLYLEYKFVSKRVWIYKFLCTKP